MRRRETSGIVWVQFAKIALTVMPRPIDQTRWFSPKRIAILVTLFLLALLPRLYSAQTVGWDWFGPGSFTVVNFDETNTCRAWLDAGYYSPLVGAQTVAISSLLGNPPPASATGDYKSAQTYCIGQKHMRVARSFSAVLGALTVVVLGIIALLLSPDRPYVAWSAALLLALSGFHATQSHMATVDAAMAFYLYVFILAMMIAATWRRVLPVLISMVLLIPAVFSKKIWPMPLFAYFALLPEKNWRWITGNTSNRDLVVVTCAALIMAAFAFNTGFQATGWYPLLALFYIFVPWRRLNYWTIPFFIALPWIAAWLSQLDLAFIQRYTSGKLTYRDMGSGFGSIGWNKFVRNILNLPVVLILGLGIPAALLIPAGIRYAIKDTKNIRLWLCLLPVLVFAAYMLFIAPRTTYRHYLPLIPAAALLASYGLWSMRIAHNRFFLALFFAWPALLLVDFELDFHQDPRRQIVAWYNEITPARVFITYYVKPPPTLQPPTIWFEPDYFLKEPDKLKLGHFLVLSENWYDTAFAQELNGPVVTNRRRLVKTRPKYARLYRKILAGNHPDLQLEREYNVQNFMPELVLHKKFYGTFQKFVGDLKVFRIVQ